MKDWLKRPAIGLAMLALPAVFALPAKSAGARVPDQLDFSMFFLTDVRDSPECHVHLDGDRVSSGEAIANSASSCPDAFAWFLSVLAALSGFATASRGEDSSDPSRFTYARLYCGP